MKRILPLILILAASLSSAQTKPQFAGMWKIIVKASGLKRSHTTTSFLLLNRDGSYTWGIDSTAEDPVKGTSKGRWLVTDAGEIKFTPEDTARQILYYVPQGDGKFIYRYTESNGKKVPVHMLEMDFLIERRTGSEE